jgi:hypothetical protein
MPFRATVGRNRQIGKRALASMDFHFIIVECGRRPTVTSIGAHWDCEARHRSTMLIRATRNCGVVARKDVWRDARSR